MRGAREDFYSARTVKGRRAYKCQFCPRPIEKGELHVSVAQCTDGRVRGHRAHRVCHEVATGGLAPAHASESAAVAEIPRGNGDFSP